MVCKEPESLMMQSMDPQCGQRRRCWIGRSTVYCRAKDLFYDIDDGVSISIENVSIDIFESLLMVSGNPDVPVSLNLSMQKVSWSFRGRSKRTVSKTDWTSQRRKKVDP